MPIHIRAEPGQYAEACLLPGDPLRAKYIAETYFEDVEQRNSERGLLGYSGTYEGKPVSVQGTGMGCPGATIVFEELIHGAVHAAKEIGQAMHVGPIVSSDVFYNPDEGQYERWSKRGVLAVEMEASALFTVGALRGVQAGCLLTVSDIVVEGEFKRITDDELRGAVDRMTQVALATVTADKGH